MLNTKNGTKIAKVLGNFDFVKTHTIMEVLDWRWSADSAVPDMLDLVDMAYYLLTKAVSNGLAASGGFEATFHDGELTLKFVVEESQMGEVE